MSEEIKLIGGYTLCRFNNPAGIPYSAIYNKQGIEVYSCEREREKDMIIYWSTSDVYERC